MGRLIPVKRMPAEPPSDPWELSRGISGGQDGADVAGLRAFKAAGIATGGYMPLGFLTHGGMRPEYAEQFGVVEHPMSGWKSRTWANVQASDGTIRFAYRWNSPGEICTLNALREYSKPVFNVNPRDSGSPHPRQCAQWIRHNGIRVLNVAGNADPDLEEFVEGYLKEVFKWLKK